MTVERKNKNDCADGLPDHNDKNTTDDEINFERLEIERLEMLLEIADRIGV